MFIFVTAIVGLVTSGIAIVGLVILIIQDTRAHRRKARELHAAHAQHMREQAAREACTPQWIPEGEPTVCPISTCRRSKPACQHTPEQQAEYLVEWYSSALSIGGRPTGPQARLLTDEIELSMEDFVTAETDPT